MSWNTCKYPDCENWARRSDGDFCSSHEDTLRKEAETSRKQSEKREQLLKKAKEKSQQPRQKINKVSPKREEENKAYTQLRGIFLMNHPYCEIQANEFCSKSATTVHHTAGRIGELFLDVSKWKGACMSCHQYAHDHPKEAIEKGWSESRLAKQEPHKI